MARMIRVVLFGWHHAVYEAWGELLEEFADTATAKTKLDGNALTFINTGTGYIALWTAGGASGYVAPSGSATILASLTDDGSTTITPSLAPTSTK